MTAAGREPRIGVDLDNTIVCYDRIFQRLARERGFIEQGVPARKGAIRDMLRAQDREGSWTELQGIAYGDAMADAEPFPGVRAFFDRCRSIGVPVWIISHRTRQPVRGSPCDLHEAAWAWLERQGFLDRGPGGPGRERVCLELTRADKLSRITRSRCTHFIDDLPELLLDPGFPGGVERLLFDPDGRHAPGSRDWRRAGSWDEVSSWLLPG
ncbi:MAG: haloacid dehalogenase-like hydrolase [Elusimicrobia bacterium]|nr:haloacid dehalogenase-like hydrolase [Elusimicrobiota bacterium]